MKEINSLEKIEEGKAWSPHPPSGVATLESGIKIIWVDWNTWLLIEW